MIDHLTDALKQFDWRHRGLNYGIAIVGFLIATAVLLTRYNFISRLFKMVANDRDAGDALFIATMLSVALLVYLSHRCIDLLRHVNASDQGKHRAVQRSNAAVIAERNQSQAQLQRKTQELSAAVDNMSQGLVMFDGAARLVVCNQRYMEMYGLSLEIAAPGRALEEIIAFRIKRGGLDADPSQFAKQVQDTVKAGKPWRSSAELGDGRTVDILTTPLPGGGWVATHDNVSERRRTERHLMRAEQLLATVIENVPTTIVLKDARSLKYILINRAGEKMYGMLRSKIIGRTAHDVFPRPTADLIVSHDKRLLAAGKEVTFGEHPIDTPGGERRVITARRLPINDEKGAPQYLLSLIDNVTERKTA